MLTAIKILEDIGKVILSIPFRLTNSTKLENKAAIIEINNIAGIDKSVKTFMQAKLTIKAAIATVKEPAKLLPLIPKN